MIQQVAGRLEIVTNGILLTHELSDKLIDAGLKRLRISGNGLCSADYEKHCGRQKNSTGSTKKHNRRKAEVSIWAKSSFIILSPVR